MKEKFINKKFKEESLIMIGTANSIIEEYQKKGFDLTLRQLYYQFVSSDTLPDHWVDKETGSTNNEKSYKKLGSIINDGRLAGLIDWDSIVDRTRIVRRNSYWDDVESILWSAAASYSVNKWENQSERIEVWVEKDALIDVVGKACSPLDTPYFSCRGYVSQSAMYEASKRISDYGCDTTIYYLGDHDPSGLDMVRDITDRLNMFDTNCFIIPIALTKYQIKRLNPPPNPAKITDSRAAKYIKEYGQKSWELDALEPEYIVELINTAIKGHIGPIRWKKQIAKEEKGRRYLENLASKS